VGSQINSLQVLSTFRLTAATPEALEMANTCGKGVKGGFQASSPHSSLALF
jgi:hypothetical protein